MFPTAEDFEKVAWLGVDMRHQQRRFYASQRGSPQYREALRQARNLEQRFDRLTKDWQRRGDDHVALSRDL